MSMAIYSRSVAEKERLRELFLSGLTECGIVSDILAYHNADELSADALRKEFNYAVLCCENETELLLAGAMMKLNPKCKMVLAVANDDLAVQSYLLGPCYCCRIPLSRESLNTILRRFSL